MSLELTLVGPMRLEDANGVSFGPKSMKARGMMVLLALAPDHRRPRGWLQERLWSDRSADQGKQSMRQCLTELRRHLGPHKAGLITEGGVVALDTNIIRVDPVLQQDPRFEAGQELCEDLDVKDPKFREWLEDQRAKLMQGANQARAVMRANLMEHGPPRTPVVALAQHDPEGAEEKFFIQIFNDHLARDLKEYGAISVVPEAQVPVGTELLRVKSDHYRNGRFWHAHVHMELAADHQYLWSDTRKIEVHGAPPIEELEMQVLIGKTATRVMNEVMQRHGDSAAGLFFRAQSLIFSLDKNAMEQADDLLQRAFELEPKAVYLSWRSFLRISQMLEHRATDKDKVIKEIDDFIATSLVMDGANSMVLAMAAQARLTVEKDAGGAMSLVRRAIDLNRANPYAWAFLAIAQMRNGQNEEAHGSAIRARYLARATPFVFWWDMLCCLTAMSLDRVEDAIRFGEAARAYLPTYRPALRYLYALYESQGVPDAALERLEVLMRVEPDFKPSLLHDPGYPSATLRNSKIIEKVPANN
ncbi:MAG: hypothetical protein AAGK28_00905 [Pseudomonadota bacterium]